MAFHRSGRAIVSWSTPAAVLARRYDPDTGFGAVETVRSTRSTIVLETMKESCAVPVPARLQPKPIAVLAPARRQARVTAWSVGGTAAARARARRRSRAQSTPRRDPTASTVNNPPSRIAPQM